MTAQAEQLTVTWKDQRTLEQRAVDLFISLLPENLGFISIEKNLGNTNDYWMIAITSVYNQQDVMLIDEDIIEHSDPHRSNVYDPDNKEWKSVTNALKGVLFADDDQLTVSLILDTVPDGKGYTEIVVLPHHDAGRYLSERTLGG